MTTAARQCFGAVLFVCAALGAARPAAAQTPPGNVVVYRVGSGGASTLITTGNPVFLDEYTPAGTLVRSISMPTVTSGANRALVASGTATSDGLITRSVDGNCLIVPGYGRDLGTGSGNLTTTGTVAGGGAIPRVVGIVRANGTIDTSTALTDASLGSNFRGAASTDCSSLWVSGTAQTSPNLLGGGVRYTNAGMTTSVDLTSSTFANVRAVSIYGGQLFTSASVTLLRGVATVGTGLPTAGPSALTKLSGLTDANSPGTYAFFLADLDSVSGLDTLYVADEGAGALTKFALVGSSWIAKGTIGTAADTYRGLTGTVNGTSVTLFATRKGGSTASGGGELVTLTDASGYNGTFAGVPTVIATAAGNTAFRGVALALPLTVTSSAGAHGTITPATAQLVAAGSRPTFTVTPDPGYAALMSGTCGGTLSGSTYTTNPITANCTVNATFTQVLFTVTPSGGENGTISPADPQSVFLGSSVSFSVVPEHGYSGTVGGTCGGALAGSIFTTSPVAADCTVVASFQALPRYTATPSSTANGSITPSTPQSVIVGDSASFDVMPAPGYNAAVRGTCGGSFSGSTYTYTINPIGADCSVEVTFAKKLVLFVGNSFTFGRVDPVMSYNTAHVTDLTYGMWLANTQGTNADEPHPWGGIPGVFKALTDQAGLDYDVSISARNAASLRGHYLNLNPAGWDLRGNIASQRWNAVVLQDLSDEPLPAGRGVNANLPFFNLYTDKIERFVHDGTADGSVPANPNARASADVYLYQTWARPDMIAPNGTNEDGTFYTAAEGLETMTADFHDAYFGRAAANPGIAGVSAVGDAFLRAVTDGIAMRDPYVPEAGKINLWHTDYFHPSKYGSYLSALVQFATLTGMNPMMFGSGELAAADLGIAPEIAVALQRVARETVLPDNVAPTTTAVVSEAPNGNGWNRHPVTVTLTAADDEGGWGVNGIAYAMSGAQMDSGTIPSGGSVTIVTEGVTTLTYFAIDEEGNAEAAQTLVVRVDSTSPVIGTLPNIAVDATSPAGASVMYHPTATDNSGLAPAMACTPAPGGVFAIGHNQVSCVATDAAGNTATSTFVVTVDGVPQQTARLIAAVLALRGINVSAPVTNLLAAVLQVVLTNGNGTLLCAGLSSFARQVTLLSGHGIPAAQAAQLVATANRIRAVQGCH